MKAERNEMPKTNHRGGIMMKKRFSTLKNEKGLTLIELLAVIVILAIVAAIAVPAIGNIINNSKDKAILAEASNILSGAKLAVIDDACGDPTADGSIDCTNEELKKHIEGVALASGDSAARDKDGKWAVTYAALTKVKGDKYKTGISSGGLISEEQLNINLKGAAKED